MLRTVLGEEPATAGSSPKQTNAERENLSFTALAELMRVAPLDAKLENGELNHAAAETPEVRTPFAACMRELVQSVEGFSMCLLEAIDAGGEASGLTTNDAAKLMTEVADAKGRLIEANDDMPLDVEFLGRADAEDNKLFFLRMRTARLLAFASLRLSDAFAAVTPDKKDLIQVQELLAVRTKHEMRLHGVCDVVVKAQAAKQE